MPALEERLWAKVDRSGGPDTCWIWTGSTARGYGHLINQHGKPTQRELAMKYGLSQAQISKIVLSQSWLGGEFNPSL